MQFPPLCRSAAFAAAALAAQAHAADDFRVRYPLSGTLGGEIAASTAQTGWFGSIVATHIDTDELTGENGERRVQPIRGNFQTPQPIAGQVRSATFDARIGIDSTQQQTFGNLIVGYLSEPEFNGGRLSLIANLPYTTRQSRRTTFSAATPTLSTLSPALSSPPLPPGAAAQAQAAAQAGFASGFQADLARQSAAQTGEVDGFGDLEVTGAWVYQQENYKVGVGATLAMPTGSYDTKRPINVGLGDFYTLRPGVALSYTPTPAVTLGMRASLGFNSRNNDNHVRSGNFGALDLAAAFRTPVGVFGPHVILVRQYQDDSGGQFGGNRFSATGAGGFFTTLIKPIGAALNFSYMRMVESRNAMSGSFYQLRMIKAF